MKFQTGDWVFVRGSGWISKVIKAVTFSKVSHVGIIYDESTIFETDIKWGKAKMNPVSKYRLEDIEVYRLPSLTWDQTYKISDLCKKYLNRPYSSLDIATNFIFSPLHPKLRGKLTTAIGNTHFQICSEQVCDIMGQATGLDYLNCSEGVTPDDLLSIAQKNLKRVH